MILFLFHQLLLYSVVWNTFSFFLTASDCCYAKGTVFVLLETDNLSSWFCQTPNA